MDLSKRVLSATADGGKAVKASAAEGVAKVKAVSRYPQVRLYPDETGMVLPGIGANLGVLGASGIFQG